MSITHCPNHPNLELVPSVARHVAVECPKCQKRWCLDCGTFAPEAWSSGRCHGCYSTHAKKARENERESHDNYVARRALLDAADAMELDLSGASAIAEWLRERAKEMDA